MTYVSANRRPNPAALAGALGIPGAIGALLVVGLAVTVVNAPPAPRLEGETITETRLPPPPPPKSDTPRADSKATTATTTTATNPATQPTTFTTDLPKGEPISTLPGTGEPVSTGLIEFGIPGPAPSVSPYDPVGAKPKGNAGRWVTNADYRSRWIMEELAGTARFRLGIDARGKVTDCTITRSTGHAPLDAATCDLVTRRARFDAARDGNGKAIAGSYTGSVAWQIPE